VQSDTLAFAWFRRAADQGFARAQLDLGKCFETGRGTVASAVEAHRWYTLASAAGMANAKESLERVAARMSPSEIAEATRLARAFVPSSTATAPSAVATVPVGTEE
jgi:TPR repeat protein